MTSGSNQSSGPNQRSDQADPHELAADSLSRGDHAVQPDKKLPDSIDSKARETHGSGSSPSPSAHVVLYQPEIPQNTGNIGRSCVACNAKLWLVRPMGFQLDEKRVRRAGLDYWKHLRLGDANDWTDLTTQLEQPYQAGRFFYLSRFAKREFWDAQFKQGDVFVFGSESGGLPDEILDTESATALRLPTSPLVRSLNLSVTAGVVLYEHMRQTGHRSK